MRTALAAFATLFMIGYAAAEPSEYEQNLIDTFVISFLVKQDCPELTLDPATSALIQDKWVNNGDIFSLSGRNGVYIKNKIEEFSDSFRRDRRASCSLALKYFGPDNPKGAIIVRPR